MDRIELTDAGSGLPIRNQGSRDTCLSLALSDCHAILRQSGALAADYLHYHATRTTGTSINDAPSLQDALAALRSNGQPDEVTCPYSPEPRSARWHPAPAATAVHAQSSVRLSQVFPHIAASIIERKQPCVLGLKINDAFRRAKDIPQLVDASGPDRALHSVLAIEMSSSYGPVLVRNSWGPHWGNSGYMWISASYLEARCITLITLTPSADPS
ncbi:C1 family peptidase [Enhygromyxa salina]|uniref:Peptidase C1A papain C-terminal domain-containing protein n=1 Tax=Enhygromyxa salina TaxID=215803 RepID=A0A2S9YA96_9BACT|nr:hypothetical protein ENSA7_56070 [Enhygromyxa salina]